MKSYLTYRCRLGYLSLLVFIVSPDVIFASQFEGKLFFSPAERAEIERLDVAEKPTSDTSALSPSRPAIAVSKTSVLASQPWISFDGLLGENDNPRLWVNKRPWTATTPIDGVTSLAWHAASKSLQVILTNRRVFALSVGQCLMQNHSVAPCSSLAGNK